MNEAEACAVVSSLYESWYPAAVRYTLRLTGRLDVAEDTVQESFMILYRDLRAGRAIENPKAWILAVIRVQVRVRMGALRHEAATWASEGDLDDLPAHMQRDPLEGEELRTLMSTLTGREQEVLFLRLAEMKYREIAKQLNISSSSVNTLLARALRKLQQAYHGEMIDVPNHQAKGNVPKTLQ